MISSEYTQDRPNVIELEQAARVCSDHERLDFLFNVLWHSVRAVERSGSMYVAGIFAV
jgi:hypothetical protein